MKDFINNQKIRKIFSYLERFCHRTSFGICTIIVGSVVLFGIFLSSNYDYRDFPYFELFSLDRILYIVIAAALLIFCLFIGKLCGWNMKICFALLISISLIFIYIVPLEPFSDMLSIFTIATNGMKDPEGYLSNYNNQIPITVYLWIISKIFGKNIIIPKIFNIVCDVVILYFVYKIYQALFEKKDECKSIVWFVGPFLPVIIYTNHIYNDVLYTALTMALLYLALKPEWSTFNYVIMCVFSVIQYVIRPVGIIYIIALTMHMVLYRKDIKKAVVYVFVSLTFITLIGKINDRVFNVDKSKQFPVWSFIQMGVNEQEFGFQDGTHSHDWTMDDCVKKYKNLGLKKVLTIYGKKTLWMWSEGTYQAERYGFGDSYAKFSRDNNITQSLPDVNNSFIRIALEKLMKAQYYIYMVLALIGIVVIRKGEKEKYNRQAVLMYLICGFFCFYLLWEIKSRYIYSMYPIIMIYAYAGWECVCKKVKHKVW